MEETTPELPEENSDSEKEKEEDQLLPSEIEIPQEVEDIIDELPEDKQKAVKGMFVSMMIKQSFSGPLPPPSILKGYEDVLPGCAERLVARMEKQSDHRMSLETFVTHEDQKQSGRGQIYGFAIAMIFLIASVILIILSHEVAGTVLGSVDLVALVSVFVIGKYQHRKD